MKPRASTTWVPGYKLPTGYGPRAGRGRRGHTRELLKQALREHGPLTTAQLVEVCGIGRLLVTNTISTARKTHGEKHFRVVGEVPPTNGWWAASIYDCGTG